MNNQRNMHARLLIAYGCLPGVSAWFAVWDLGRRRRGSGPKRAAGFGRSGIWSRLATVLRRPAY